LRLYNLLDVVVAVRDNSAASQNVNVNVKRNNAANLNLANVNASHDAKNLVANASLVLLSLVVLSQNAVNVKNLNAINATTNQVVGVFALAQVVVEAAIQDSSGNNL
jgi:hypothetical protein